MKWKRKEKWTLGSIGSAAYLSGTALFCFAHYVRVATTVGEQRHPAEHWLRLVHSTATYAVVMGMGYLWKTHIRPGMRGKKRKKTGYLNLTAIAAIWVSALGLLYLSDDDWILAVGWVHGILGLSLPIWIFLHVLGRRKKMRLNPIS